MARKTKTRNTNKVLARLLADRLEVTRPREAFALPYFTRNGGDTEYLISNPTASVVSGTLAVFGKSCKVVKKIDVKLKPNCTQSVRFQPIVPDQAGHAVLVADGKLVVHILYMSGRGLVVEGGELAGSDNLFQWMRTEKSRTYAFGYRALALGHDKLGGSIFVSNPHATVLSGVIVFFDQNCRAVQRKGFRIRPGCTQEFKFPIGRFGYGRVRVSNQAVINVLHFTASSAGLAAAELVGESNLIDVPAEPKPGKRILFDDTHQCRPGAVGDWTDYEAALNAAGYSVAHYTAATVTLSALQAYDVFVIAMARLSYSAAEKTAISSYVNQGGGLMIVQDFGNAPWSGPTREMLNLFGANDDNNIAIDTTHNDNNNSTTIVFDYQRNFHAHPIVNGWKYFNVGAVATLSGGTGWATIAETDDDSTPVRRPVLLGRAFGQGRVVAFGDSNTWANHMLMQRENKLFGIRCAEWLLLQI